MLPPPPQDILTIVCKKFLVNSLLGVWESLLYIRKRIVAT